MAFLQGALISMRKLISNRRLRDRRGRLGRRSTQQNAPETSQAYCERLNLRLTAEECHKFRNGATPPQKCLGCPGVSMDRRSDDRRMGVDRRR